MKNLKEYYPQLTENEVARGINQALIDVDESLSYKDFAIGVAAVLKDEYGSHNFNPFMEVLHAELGMDESLNESVDKETLKRELEDKFNVRPIISNFNGKIDQIQFDTRSEFSDNEWNEILDYIKSKGFEITKESNYADEEPGERSWYPRIDVK